MARTVAGITAVAALGGHGMTLAFGLAEQIVGGMLDPVTLRTEEPA